MTGDDYLPGRFLKLIARIHKPPQSAKMLDAMQNGRIAVAGPYISGYSPALLATKAGRYNLNSKMPKAMFAIAINPMPMIAIRLFNFFAVQLPIELLKCRRFILRSTLLPSPVPSGK